MAFLSDPKRIAAHAGRTAPRCARWSALFLAGLLLSFGLQARATDSVVVINSIYADQVSGNSGVNKTWSPIGGVTDEVYMSVQRPGRALTRQAWPPAPADAVTMHPGDEMELYLPIAYNSSGDIDIRLWDYDSITDSDLIGHLYITPTLLERDGRGVRRNYDAYYEITNGARYVIGMTFYDCPTAVKNFPLPRNVAYSLFPAKPEKIQLNMPVTAGGPVPLEQCAMPSAWGSTAPTAYVEMSGLINQPLQIRAEPVTPGCTISNIMVRDPGGYMIYGSQQVRGGPIVAQFPGPRDSSGLQVWLFAKPDGAYKSCDVRLIVERR